MTERVRGLVADVLGIPVAAIEESRDRGEYEAWDSLNHLRIVSAVEEAFDVRLGMDEIEGVRCVRDLDRLVHAHRADA